MRTIHKFPLNTKESSQILRVPGSAKFVSVIEQYGKPMLYALVDPEVMTTEVEVLVRNTGQPIEQALLLSHIFLGTVKLNDGSLILHVFVPRTASYL